MIRRRLLVSGRVQGVFYRDSCRRQAQQLGLVGWARNLADGRVEVVVQGPTEDIQALERWCRTGSEQSVVTDVETSDEPVGELDGFDVR